MKSKIATVKGKEKGRCMQTAGEIHSQCKTQEDDKELKRQKEEKIMSKKSPYTVFKVRRMEEKFSL